jgi:hypothetical protein
MAAITHTFEDDGVIRTQDDFEKKITLIPPDTAENRLLISSLKSSKERCRLVDDDITRISSCIDRHMVSGSQFYVRPIFEHTEDWYKYANDIALQDDVPFAVVVNMGNGARARGISAVHLPSLDTVNLQETQDKMSNEFKALSIDVVRNYKKKVKLIKKTTGIPLKKIDYNKVISNIKRTTRFAVGLGIEDVYSYMRRYSIVLPEDAKGVTLFSHDAETNTLRMSRLEQPLSQGACGGTE